MAKRRVISSESPPSNLVVTLEVAKQKIQEQINKGKNIQNTSLTSEQAVQEAQANLSKWKDYVYELLLRLFNNGTIAHEFLNSYGPMMMVSNLSDSIYNFQNDIQAKLVDLESIYERLDLINVSTSQINDAEVSKDEKNSSQNIFIVHGHDESTKAIVARYIAQLGLNPIILHEQAGQSRTLIEKLEHYSDVGYAIVILTPDDMGYSKVTPDNISPRARQNVICELGYFVGKLGRNRVAVLYIEGVEIPSDFSGVEYIPYDSTGGWKMLLAREIKKSGVSVDMNRAI